MSFFQADSLRVEVREDGTGLLRFDVPGRTHNLFSRRVLADLDAALDRLANHQALRVLVLLSDKPSGFMAGADLQEFSQIREPAQALAASEAGQRVFDKLARLPVP